MADLPLDLINLHISLQYIIIYDKLLQYISVKKGQKLSLKIAFFSAKIDNTNMLKGMIQVQGVFAELDKSMLVNDIEAILFITSV
jgi:hypothetical protein